MKLKGKTETDGLSTRHAVLDLSGATCGSCVYTIEHVGRKMAGIRDIGVDVASGKIYIDYTGGDEVLTTVVGIVRKLGYDASIAERDTAKSDVG